MLQTEAMKIKVAELLSMEIRLLEVIADDAIELMVCTKAAEMGMVYHGTVHAVKNGEDFVSSMVEDFTKENWVRAAVALHYMFVGNLWQKTVQDTVLEKFSKPIKLCVEYGSVDRTIPEFDIRKKGRPLRTSLHKLISKRLCVFRQQIMRKVRKDVGWDLLFRKKTVSDWVYGKDDMALLQGMLRFKRFGSQQRPWGTCVRTMFLQKTVEQYVPKNQFGGIQWGGVNREDDDGSEEGLTEKEVCLIKEADSAKRRLETVEMQLKVNGLGVFGGVEYITISRLC